MTTSSARATGKRSNGRGVLLMAIATAMLFIFLGIYLLTLVGSTPTTTGDKGYWRVLVVYQFAEKFVTTIVEEIVKWN